jgi:Esterase FrsA-like
MARLRRAARGAHLRALTLRGELGSCVSVDLGRSTVQGYFHTPVGKTRLAVVLVNGLDSIAEVELHAFGTWFLERGIAVLALDLPAGGGPRFKSPCFAVEAVASRIVDWLFKNSETRSVGAFGVSFGGNLVARLMSGDSRFAAGIAVSPIAYVGENEFHHQRLRTMIDWTFGSRQTINQVGGANVMDVNDLPQPSGDLLVCEMSDDKMFGRDHSLRMKEWFGPKAAVHKFPGEHVGTSQFHVWLPFACDWLLERLSKCKGAPHAPLQLANVHSLAV